MPANQRFDREHVAAIIIESIDLGLPLVSTVMAVMGCTTNQARHMIRTVRHDGHLGAAPHHPAKATIHRGSAESRSWMVCEHCMTAWPCAQAYPYGRYDAKARGTHPDEQAPRKRRRRAERAEPAGR